MATVAVCLTGTIDDRERDHFPDWRGEHRAGVDRLQCCRQRS
jgi:hypothetical protein